MSIRNFAVVETLDAEFDAGFTVLTGETGAGKSILLDALSLLLGDRFEARQLRPGAERAEIAAEFDLSDALAARAWLSEHDLGDAETLLLRRVLDAQGKSRAWINGSPATLAQLEAVGEQLIDLHGQHAHQSLVRAETQRELLDAFGGFATLATEVAAAWRTWRAAAARRESGARDAASRRAEHDALAARHEELSALGATDGGMDRTRRGAVAARARRRAAGSRDHGRIRAGRRRRRAWRAPDRAGAPAAAGRVARRSLDAIVTLVDDARIGIDEAGRMLRHYRERLELDPAELARVEARLAAIHDVARKFRVRPEELPQLAADTGAALDALSADTTLPRWPRPRPAPGRTTMRSRASFQPSASSPPPNSAIA